jgi:hypothetical protein
MDDSSTVVLCQYGFLLPLSLNFFKALAAGFSLNLYPTNRQTLALRNDTLFPHEIYTDTFNCLSP